MPATTFPLADAQTFATLAAIAYAGDMEKDANPTIEELHKAINTQLKDRPHYATGDDWSLAWGPVESTSSDNLVFAAYRADTQTLAVVIRGTTTQTWSRFEDIPRSQTSFPTGDQTGAAVSSEFLAGLGSVLNLKDTKHDQTLSQFFSTCSVQMPVSNVAVCGHSQGAALTPMMMFALQQGLAGAPKVGVPVRGYAIAPPTSGNPAFAQLANTELDCWFVVNPRDIVPLGYDRMSATFEDGIPTYPSLAEMPEVIAAVEAANVIADIAGKWAQPTRRAVLPNEMELNVSFFEQIGDEHNHNTYLHLMGAVQTDVGDPSPFARETNPIIGT